MPDAESRQLIELLEAASVVGPQLIEAHMFLTHTIAAGSDIKPARQRP